MISFNRDIRPILSENCFYCHGQDPQQRKADVRLDERDAAIGAGAIAPGKPDQSELIARIHASDPKELMPPAKSNRRLSEEQKRLLRAWIEQGAPYERHWAFVAPVKPAPPAVRRAQWGRNEIDAFVLALLERSGLSPSPEADRVTLARRLWLDLLGLPPTPSEVDAFVADTRPDAYERLVDRLMASERYGERMALPWLDAARYADSNGFQQDGDTWQWIWRDGVVDALNADVPFDRFSIEQLAGDLLERERLEREKADPGLSEQAKAWDVAPPRSPRAHPSAPGPYKPSIARRIASGFNRNHLLNGEGGAIAEEQRFVNLFDRVDVTATNWLGLTLACAQCHDHKYDPMTMRDYYGMLAGFNQLPESGTPQRLSERIRVAQPWVELPTPENLQRIAEFEAQEKAAGLAGDEGSKKRYEEELAKYSGNARPTIVGLPARVRELLTKPADQRTDAERRELSEGLKAHFDKSVWPGIAAKLPANDRVKQVRDQLNKYRNDRVPRVMVMEDSRRRDTHLLDRGNYEKPLAKVEFATPAFLPAMPADFPRNRLGLARWLFLPEHPLTARVQVNRQWQTFFGAGLVRTTEDLGVQGEPPVHRELLDYLAVTFREQGWSMKKLQRLIVTSATYRQSSRVSVEHLQRDPENRLYARAPRFRLPAMILRDLALASAGLLDDRIGGVPVYPYQPEGIWDALAITKERDFTYPASPDSDLHRRSLYTFFRRTVGPANLFDASNRQACKVRTAITNTPLHALTTLNDPTWVEAGRVLAQRCLEAPGDESARLALAYRRVMARQPTSGELGHLTRALARQRGHFAASPESARALLKVGRAPRDEKLDAVEHAAWASVCLLILNLDEALTRE